MSAVLSKALIPSIEERTAKRVEQQQIKQQNEAKKKKPKKADRGINQTNILATAEKRRTSRTKSVSYKEYAFFHSFTSFRAEEESAEEK